MFKFLGKIFLLAAVFYVGYERGFKDGQCGRPISFFLMIQKKIQTKILPFISKMINSSLRFVVLFLEKIIQIISDITKKKY
jgi:hypothetical protein